jgi:cytochrome oxidase Cu insertion factor (SCO1/SenC/PrrC family)
MRYLSAFALGALIALLPAGVAAQPDKKKNEADFAKEKPAVGDTLPDLTVYSPDGKEVKLSSLRGSHVVLTFGCLT